MQDHTIAPPIRAAPPPRRLTGALVPLHKRQEHQMLQLWIPQGGRQARRRLARGVPRPGICARPQQRLYSGAVAAGLAGAEAPEGSVETSVAF